ncbi:MAG: sulfotransferase family protein [Phenylobacterium sp.]|nr:MAG: sulfotransferase family protein [Phenylobacterium sp.]
MPGDRRQRLIRAQGSDAALVSRSLDEAAAAFAAGRLEAAARAYRKAERLAPDDLRAVYSLAVIDLRTGRADQARRRLEAVVAREPGHMAAQHNLAVVRQQLGDWPGAARAYARALALRPEAAETRQALATALTILGQPAEAIGHHRVLAAAPATRWAALTRIALIDPAAIDDTELADMARAVDAAAIDGETRIALSFALGEALERRGRDAEAFAAFAAGNRAKQAALQAVSPPTEVAAAHAAAVAHVKALFTPAFLAANAGKGSRSAAPIFVVGFPRSGSTLIEQILASHPEVQGLGETAILPGLLAGRYPPGPRVPAAKLRDLAERYLAAAKDRGWNAAPRFIDKTLENYLHVGLIQLIFPRAVILHSVRDPMDTGLSCYRQLFASGNETLYDLAGIGAEYRRYREVMDHWRAVLPGRVVEVDHEALVADPEAAIPALVAAAGLPWDPATLRFFERDGAVATASASQVRRPIFQGSVQRWRRYEAELAPLKAALGL